MRRKQTERINIMIGTAGHIDHGKTELTKLLTGCDTDRLRAEKERGMSLELGFAPWYTPDERVVGIVDVPGHERFVRKMVAAATCVELLLLVVAADDGVMPQTREHLDICTLLGVERGMVALTKIDLVDEDHQELAAEDVRALVQGTFLEGAPIVPVSPITGEGFEDFHNTLHELVTDTPVRQTSGVFRMPVERRFVQKGSGTIITGIPQSGSVSVGDTLELLPLGQSGRVRGLQVYRMEDETARAGECVALNIPSLDHHTIRRGQVLAEPGWFGPTTSVSARLRLLPSAKPLRNRATVRFHTGMLAAVGTVVLLERDQLLPADECLVQLLLEQPVVAATGDPVVIRLHSPVVAIGGGVVLDCERRRLRRYRQDVLDRLRERAAAVDEDRLLQHELLMVGPTPLGRDALARRVKLSSDELTASLEPLVADGEVLEIGRRGELVHGEHVGPIRDRLLELLGDFHQREPLRLGMPLADLGSELAAPEALLDHLLGALEAGGEVMRDGDLCRLATHQADLSPDQQDLLGQLEHLYLAARFATPDQRAAAEQLGAPLDEVTAAIGRLCDRGTLVEVEPGIIFHRQAIEEARNLAVEQIRGGGPMPTPSFRDLIGATRKHAVPLLDYFDRVGVTLRVGNTRVLAPPRDPEAAS